MDSDDATGQAFEELEERWRTFWRASPSYNKEAVEKSNSAEVGEKFWVDVVLRNPLDTEVSLKDVTIRVREVGGQAADVSVPEGVELEKKPEISLAPKELRTVSRLRLHYVYVLPPHDTRESILGLFLHSRFACCVSGDDQHILRFSGLLPMEETLGVRGRRLNDTAAQRETATYASDVLMRVDVRKSGGRLNAELSATNEPMPALGVGEIRKLSVRITNVGSTGVRDLWAVFGESENAGLVWLDVAESSEGKQTSCSDPHSGVLTGRLAAFLADDLDSRAISPLITTPNSLSCPLPTHVPLEQIHGSELEPSQSFEIPLCLQAHLAKPLEVAILFVFRQVRSF